MQTKPVVSRAKAYLKVRHKAVRDAMKQLKLDGLLLTHPADLAYLTNFTGNDSVGLITEKGFYLASDFRYQEQAQLEAGWLSIYIKEAKLVDAIAKMIKDAKIDRVGFEANFTTFGQIDAVDRAVKELKKASSNGDTSELTLVPLEDVMVNIRKVKDDNEIDLIRKSIDIAQQAFEAIKADITPGQTENYIAGQLIAELRSRGAADVSFPPIVAAGANSSLPHYRPGEKEVTFLKDQPVLVDWGCVYRGYCSDLTRMVMLGRVSPKIKEIYKVVLAAHDAAIKFLRPGVTTVQADRVARDVIEAAGYGKEFGHGLGHGIGREVHELPRMSKWIAEEELRPGMIVTVEPGIYIPGEGGVRIEDDVLITHSSNEVLSSLDRSFEGCHMSEKRKQKKDNGKAKAAAPSISTSGPMDLGLLGQLVKLMADNGLSTVELTDGEKRILLKRGDETVAMPAAMPYSFSAAPTAQASAAAASKSGGGEAAPDSEAGLIPIKSPMVGTFYAAPSKGAKPYVTVGSSVDETTDVCIIEAMKNFNVHKAETRGTIAKILVQDGEPVEFGQALFLVKPS